MSPAHEDAGSHEPPADVRQRIASRVRRLREALGISQEELGRRAGGVNKGTVNLIEQGTNTQIDTLLKLCGPLGVSFETLVIEREPDLPGHTGTGVLTDAVREDVDVRKGFVPDAIPVIAEGEATPNGMVWTTTVVRHVVIEYIARPFDLDDPDAYGLLVMGDSMAPTFRKGHRLIASPNTPVEDGDEVYVQLADGRRLIKVAHRTETGWRLESLNPTYDAINIATEDVHTIHPIVWAKRKKPGLRVIDEETGRRR